MKQVLIIITLFSSCLGKSQSWSPLDTGLVKFPYCLLGDTVNDRLFAFGDFFSVCNDTTTCPTGIVAWNGIEWENWFKDTIKGGTDDAAYFNGRVYYTQVFYDSMNNIKTYLLSFSSRNDLDTIAMLQGWQQIYDYCIWNNKLIITGISNYAGSPTGGILMFDGTNWIPFGIQSGISYSPYLCTAYNNNLIVSANSSGIGYFLLEWNGTNWSQLGNAFNGSMCYISDILPYNNKIYAVGGFFQMDDPSNPGNFIAAWDGSQWSDVGGGTWNNYVIPNGNIYTACVYQNKLFVGGSFIKAGGVLTPSFACWNDTLWCGYGIELYDRIIGGLLVHSGNLYASIVVDTMFGQKFNGIAKWNTVAPDSCGVQWIGISETETLNSMNVFPNPASNTINISFTNPFHSEITLNVFDIFGKEITSKNLGRSQGDLTYPLDITGFADGVYSVKLRLGEHILTKKFIKQN